MRNKEIIHRKFTFFFFYTALKNFRFLTYNLILIPSSQNEHFGGLRNNSSPSAAPQHMEERKIKKKRKEKLPSSPSLLSEASLPSIPPSFPRSYVDCSTNPPPRVLALFVCGSLCLAVYDNFSDFTSFLRNTSLPVIQGICK